MNESSHKTRVGFALLTAAALAVAPLMLGGQVHAAETILGPDDVAPYQDSGADSDTFNYDQWHVGSTSESDAELEQSFLFGECSVTAVNPGNEFDPWPQMHKGYPSDARPAGIDEILAVIQSASLDVESGSAVLQFALLAFDEDGNPVEEIDFLQSTPPGSGAITITNDDEVTFSVTGNSYPSLEAWADFMRPIFSNSGQTIELFGVGFTASADEATVVNSITFDGNTYKFGTDCDGETPDEEDPDAPTPPDTVETAAGDATGLFLMGGLMLAVVGVFSVRFSVNSRKRNN